MEKMKETVSGTEMTDEQYFKEMVWDKIQTGEYIIFDGQILDYETGEIICEHSSIRE